MRVILGSTGIRVNHRPDPDEEHKNHQAEPAQRTLVLCHYLAVVTVNREEDRGGEIERERERDAIAKVQTRTSNNYCEYNYNSKLSPQEKKGTKRD